MQRRAKRKSIKKLVASVVAGAMALAMMAVPNVDALADAGTYSLIGNQFGNWTSDADTAAAYAMTAGTDEETYTFTTTAGTMYEFKAYPTAEAGANWWQNAIGVNGANASFFAKEASETTITLKDGALTWNNTDKNIDPNPAEEYYVVGSMNGWGDPEATKMTKNETTGLYEAVFTQIAGAKHEFKIAQDYPTYGWYKSWGDVNGNYANADGLAWDYETLTVTFDPNEGKATSTAVEAEAPAQPETPDEPADPDATTVTVHVSTAWAKPNFYAFTTADQTALTGGWPGAKMSANEANAGYYSAKITLDAVEDITFIINGTDAETTASVQTVNIPATIVKGANEIWVTIGALAEEPDEFGNVNYTATTSTTAPDGWVAGDVADTEVPEEPTGNDNTTTEPGDDAEVKFLVNMRNFTS